MSKEETREEVDPAYQERIAANKWHDIDELDAFVSAIKRLSADDSNWSWARNTRCKYIELRFDMRDGGFVMCDREGRISIPELEWQYGDRP